MERFEVSELLIEAGADIKAKDTSGRTIIMMVLDTKFLKGIVRLLIEWGADVNS